MIETINDEVTPFKLEGKADSADVSRFICKQMQKRRRTGSRDQEEKRESRESRERAERAERGERGES